MESISKQKKVQHLFLRAGFGARLSEVQKSESESVHEIVSTIFENSKSCSVLSLQSDAKNTDEMKRKELTKTEKKKLRKQSRESIRELNVKWIDKMANDTAQLREKMTLFWHGHFACRTPVALFCLNQNNTIRKHALGNFRELLLQISKDPAMLQFLNNQQNRKASPNENFAREVMELFTLGRGNYEENDIKEAARAFTGWGFNKDGEFTFRKRFHDYDVKTIFGKSGNYTGEDVIDLILEKKRTAEFIVEKIYRYFVNEIPDNEIIRTLAVEFYSSDYDIESLMKSIFTSDWFYENENIGSLIKSPVELIVSMSRSLDVTFKNPKSLIAIQKALGQILFYPPNVSGWAGGKNWIDTSSLVHRMKLSEAIFKSSGLEFDYKDDLPEMGERYNEMSQKEQQQYKQIRASANLSDLFTALSRYDDEQLTDKLTEYLLQKDPDSGIKKILKSYADDSTRENLIESLTMRIISLPEYQLV